MVIVLLKGVDFIDKRKTRVASSFSVRASEWVSERVSERGSSEVSRIRDEAATGPPQSPPRAR